MENNGLEDSTAQAHQLVKERDEIVSLQSTGVWPLSIRPGSDVGAWHGLVQGGGGGAGGGVRDGAPAGAGAPTCRSMARFLTLSPPLTPPPRDALERPYTAGGGGGTPPLPEPPPPLPIFEADSQNFALVPSVPRGFRPQISRQPSAGTIGGPGRGGSQPSTPSPPPSSPFLIHPSQPPPPSYSAAVSCHALCIVAMYARSPTAPLQCGGASNDSHCPPPTARRSAAVCSRVPTTQSPPHTRTLRPHAGTARCVHLLKKSSGLITLMPCAVCRRAVGGGGGPALSVRFSHPIICRGGVGGRYVVWPSVTQVTYGQWQMEMAPTVTVTVTGTVTAAICCKVSCPVPWFCVLLSRGRPPFVSWLSTLPVKGSWPAHCTTECGHSPSLRTSVTLVVIGHSLSVTREVGRGAWGGGGHDDIPWCPLWGPVLTAPPLMRPPPHLMYPPT